VSRQIPLDAARVVEFLFNIGAFERGEPLDVEPVGDGNINWVRRVRGRSGSRVVKQARPALERFPEYRVSTERIVFEARYYEETARFDRCGVLPRVLHFDAEQRILVLEDLGGAERLDASLARGADASGAAATLGGFLGAVHAGTGGGDLAARFENDAMRRLHGDHIFHLPYRANDFPLSPEVAARAHAIQQDAELVAIIDGAYARYLEPRGVLVHGDVQPANVLLTGTGPKLLDAEIAHVGDPAFDAGQLVGHLLLPAAARRRPDEARPAVEAAWSAYIRSIGSGEGPDFAAAIRYAGVELLRRTIGAARVPAVASNAASLAVLDAAERLVRHPPDSPADLFRSFA